MFHRRLTLKVKLLAVLLTASVLLNIAGIVFFILFLDSQGKLKTAKREKVAAERQLAVMRSSNVIGDALLSDKILRRTFVSHADGQMDNYALQPPQYVPDNKNYTLVVYLHGMGSNYLEPFVTPNEQTIADNLIRKVPSVGILSCNYRKDASWGSDNAVSDITQNIRLALQEFPFTRIVLVGTSMGACTALTYAATAPKDVKEKIAGVVAIEGAGDLAKLYYETSHKGIAPAMIMAFGGRPDMIADVYKKKSFNFNLESVPSGMKFYLLGARQDKIVPFAFQEEIKKQLEARNLKVMFEAIDGPHGVPPAEQYSRGVEYVLSTNSN